MYNEFIKFFGQEGKKFFSENADRFDLKSANIYLLKKNGISNNQIFNLHKCSHCNNEFFSYRKGDLTQRTFNIIKLKK
jgi:copper oxidase (laccase) domain-containing protein